MSLSGDGTKLAVARYLYNHVYIFVAKADGTSAINVSAAGGGNDYSPQLSFDGSSVLFTHYPMPATSQICYAPCTENAALTEVTSTARFGSPALSQSGKLGAWLASAENGYGPLTTGATDGSASQTASTGNVYAVRVSGDGSRVAYVQDGALYVGSFDGKSRQKVVGDVKTGLGLGFGG